MKKALILFGICILLVTIGARIKKDWFRHRLLKKEAQELMIQNQNLSEEAQRLERLKKEGSREEVLEREARTMLGLQKQGEHVVLVLPVNNGAKPVSIPVQQADFMKYLTYFQNFIAQIPKLWYNLKNLFQK